MPCLFIHGAINVFLMFVIINFLGIVLRSVCYSHAFPLSYCYWLLQAIECFIFSMIYLCDSGKTVGSYLWKSDLSSVN